MYVTFLSKYLLQQSGNLAHQKKFYKLLSGILLCDSSEHSLFVEENITRLQKLLLGSLSTAGAGSKKVFIVITIKKNHKN